MSELSRLRMMIAWMKGVFDVPKRSHSSCVRRGVPMKETTDQNGNLGRRNPFAWQINKKLICFPVEIYNREFYTKLYMALVSCSRGYQALIGEMNNRVIRNSRNGVILYKDHAVWSESLFERSVSRGMVTCALDEEGLIMGDAVLYLRTRASEKLLASAGAIFYWGMVQKKTMRNKISTEKNQYIVGSPKFDLCYLEKNRSDCHSEIKETRKRILINTRFSYTNGIYNGDDLDVLIGLGVIASEKDVESYQLLLKSEENIFHEFLKLVDFLSKHDDVSVTIRPHPAEHMAIYENLKKQYTTLTIDRSADLREQILDHDCVVHDGCTTALEALALGKPVFGLRPNGLTGAYDDFANNFSINFTTAEELSGYIVSTDTKNYDICDADTFAKDYIANWGGRPSSTYTMMDIIDKFNVTPQKIYRPSVLSQIDIKNVAFIMLKSRGLLYSIMCKLVGTKLLDRFVNRRLTIDNKFPHLKKDVILASIDRLCRLDPNLPGRGSISVEFINDKSILMYSVK